MRVSWGSGGRDGTLQGARSYTAPCQRLAPVPDEAIQDGEKTGPRREKFRVAWRAVSPFTLAGENPRLWRRKSL